MYRGDCMPKNKKKKSGQPGQALKREPRLRKARQWLAAYDGEEHRIVRRYRDKFKGDIPTALRDLQESGHVFAPEYVDAVLRGEEQRLLKKAMKKQEQSERDVDWRDAGFSLSQATPPGARPMA